MALTYNRQQRDLSIRGYIALMDGTTLNITADDVATYSIDSSLGTGLMLGATDASSYQLELDNTPRNGGSQQRFDVSDFDGAEVAMQIGISDDGGSTYTWSAFGVWYVETSSAPEQSVTIALRGNDALATHFGSKFNDAANNYPTTLGTLASRMALAANVNLARTNFPNAALTVPSKPEWNDDVTVRDIVGYIAICAGGFAVMTRAGKLDIRGFSEGAVYEIDGDLYQTRTPNGGSAFDFNCVEAYITQDAEDYTRYAVDDWRTDTATNCIQLDYNPLLKAGAVTLRTGGHVLNSVVNELSTLPALDAVEISWGGDPSVQLGDRWVVTGLSGTTNQVMVLSQSFSFSGGLSVNEQCDLPSMNTETADTYSTGASVFTKNGAVRATKIAGLDDKVISATTGYIGNLTSETIQTNALIANIIGALNLTADVATIEKLSATILQAQSITSDLIAAGTITTDKLNTADLQATVATIASATIANANIDFAKIKIADIGTGSLDNLIVRDQSNMDKVWIDRLKVRNAQLVTATVDELIVKASDGKYYRLDIGTNGAIVPTNITTTLTDSEITAGITADGHKTIIETDLTVDDLATSSFRATTALIDKITTDRLNADVLFANEAFIGKLQTSEIYAGKSLSVLIGDMYDDDGKIGNMMRYDEDGLHVGAKDYSTEVLIDEDSVNIKNSGTMKSEFADRYIQFGNYQLRMSADGGLVFKVKE